MFAAGVFRKIAAFFMAIIATFTTPLGTTMKVTDGEPIMATQRDYGFNNDRLLIGGYNYDLQYADATHVSYVKEAGIDFLITSVNQTFLDLCEQNNVGVIASSYNAPSMYWDASGSPGWYSITPATYKNHPAIWGDNLIDEPTSAGFATLGSVTNYYYANTTGKLPYINLFPIYASAEQLGNSPNIETYKKILLPLSDFSDASVDSYKRHVSEYINKINTDYISVDIYPLGIKKDLTGTAVKTTSTKWLRNLDILGEACRKTNRDLWVITQAAGDYNSGSGNNRYCDTPQDIRWQAYVSLSFGTKAIIHACYNSGWWDRDSHLIDAAGNRTKTYYAVQTVDNELKAFADIYGGYNNLGAFLMNGISAAGTDYGFLMPVDESAKPTVKSVSPLLIGCFKGEVGNSKAYTVVNMTEPQKDQSVSATLAFDGAKKLTVYKKGVATVINANTCTLNLESCEGVFIIAE
ncbi:MAG: hypothetical protein WCN92_05410 [Eubacteriales bacterium]